MFGFMSKGTGRADAGSDVDLTDRYAVPAPRSSRRRRRAGLLAACALSLGATSLLAASPAQASVSSCSSGRCTIYLSKSETYDLGQFRVPPAPAPIPGQLRAAYYAAAYGHSWFARQYASQGKCSAFTLSIHPWETQGYYGYSCSWN